MFTILQILEAIFIFLEETQLKIESSIYVVGIFIYHNIFLLTLIMNEQIQIQQHKLY